MRIARKLGTITYRSADEWRNRFARSGLTEQGLRAVQNAKGRVPDGFAPRFAVEGYLESQAERFVRIFDPNCYLYLSRAMDCFDLSDHGDPPEVFARAAFESALVIGVESDFLFAIEEQAAIADALSRGGIKTEFARLPCVEGHDAFLVDLPRFDAAIRGFLNR
jgi:homoserine O-acetyltransferase